MKIKELLTDESKWTQEKNAINSEGMIVPPKSETAVSWCLYGASVKCYPDKDERRQCINKMYECINKMYGNIKDVIKWNDDPKRTFDEVKELVENLDI